METVVGFEIAPHAESSMSEVKAEESKQGSRRNGTKESLSHLG